MPNAEGSVKIAEALEVRTNWLILGHGDRFERSPEALQDWAVPVVDTIKALETGLWDDIRVFRSNLLLDDLMVSQMGLRDTHGLIALINEGDENEPWIADGAPVIVDRRDTRLRGGLWAYLLGPHLLIRRLRPTGADAVEAIPANPTYNVERYEGEARQHLGLIGRVIWTATTLK